MKTVSAGIIITAVAIWALLYADIPWIWVVANCTVGITWGFTISYLLGLASRFDTTGQMAALGGFASKMGLASGPVVTAWLLGEDNFPLVIWVSTIGMGLILLTLASPARLQDRLIRRGTQDGE
jgi:hypothetical protein